MADGSLVFRCAESSDVPRIAAIIRQAQARMGAAGSSQWQDGYPDVRHIEADLHDGIGYVLCRRGVADDSAVVAYGAVSFDGEPAYDAIEGQWRSEGPYVVLHRLAVAGEAVRQGLATEFFRRAGELARMRSVGIFRVDTNFDNRGMLRLLEREGFVYCGKVRYESGERLAFEKRIR